MTQQKTIRLSDKMKDVVLKMRQKKPRRLLFWNYKYRGAFLDEEPINNKTFDGLYERELIKMVVNVSSFARYELTEQGYNISIK